MADWLALSRGEMTPDETDHLLSQSAADLHAFLESQPQAVERVLDILGRRLSDGIKVDTWERLIDGLTIYLGQDLAYLVAWMAESEQARRLQHLEKHSSPEVIDFLRSILGTCGSELQKAYAWWNELPADWHTVFRDVYYDQLKRRHHLRVRIEKYNGEELLLEGNPDSILYLAASLLRTVRLVGTPDAFSQGQIANFVGETAQLVKLLNESDQLVKLLLPEGEKASFGSSESEAHDEDTP